MITDWPSLASRGRGGFALLREGTGPRVHRSRKVRAI